MILLFYGIGSVSGSVPKGIAEGELKDAKGHGGKIPQTNIKRNGKSTTQLLELRGKSEIRRKRRRMIQDKLMRADQRQIRCNDNEPRYPTVEREKGKYRPVWMLNEESGKLLGRANCKTEKKKRTPGQGPSERGKDLTNKTPTSRINSIAIAPAGLLPYTEST